MQRPTYPRELPEALAGYFAALDNADMDSAVENFSADCLYAPPQASRAGDSTSEIEPRATIRGRTALLDRFRERGAMPHRHFILRTMTTENRTVLYGVGRASDGSPWATFLNSATIDSDGLIARYVGFYCAPALVDDPWLEPTTEDPPSACVDSAQVARWSDALSQHRADVLAAHLADDCFISLAPTPGSRRSTSREASSAIRQLLAAPKLDRIDQTVIVSEAAFHLEGTTLDADGSTGTHVASGCFDQHGLLSRYVEFRTQRQVGPR